MFASFLFTTTFSGLITTGEYDPPILWYTLLTIISVWLGSGLIIEAIERNKFQFQSYLIISGVYSVALIPMMVLGGQWYFLTIYEPIMDAIVNQPSMLQNIVNTFIFYIPFNVSFFGYLLLTGYGSSFTQSMSGRKYLFYYTMAILLTLTIATMVGKGLPIIT